MRKHPARRRMARRSRETAVRVVTSSVASRSREEGSSVTLACSGRTVVASSLAVLGSSDLNQNVVCSMAGRAVVSSVRVVVTSLLLVSVVS